MSHSCTEPRRLKGPRRLLKVLLHLRQDRLMPGLASRLGVPHAALERFSHARQAEGHADIAVRWTLAPSDARWPDELPRRDPVEPGDVDANTKLLTLAGAVSYASR